MDSFEESQLSFQESVFFMMGGPHVHSHPVCFFLLSNSFSDAMLLRETEMVVDALSCMSHMKQEKEKQEYRLYRYCKRKTLQYHIAGQNYAC